MERAVGKVRKERAELLAERRRQDIMDMDKECSQPEGLCVYMYIYYSTEFSLISAHHHHIIILPSRLQLVPTIATYSTVLSPISAHHHHV